MTPKQQKQLDVAAGGKFKVAEIDTKALREVIRLRKIERAAREEQEMVLETYLVALGEA